MKGFGAVRRILRQIVSKGTPSGGRCDENESSAMRILVLNSGSSSIKFSVFVRGDDAALRMENDGQLSGIGGDAAELKVSRNGETGDGAARVTAATVPQAIQLLLDAVSKVSGGGVDAVGYRVVHPGATLRGHQRITPEVLRLLDEAKEFAPLHDPEAVELIRAAMRRFPEAAHYACFDTVFHETMPEEARTYPLPAVYRESGVHRYGFHGLSCESIVRRMAAAGPMPRRMVLAHLGSGCSVTALRDGHSVDTTMGLTPTGGVLMGTRCGDLDPGLVLYLLRQQSGSRDEAASAVETLLNHGSGISVVSGMANDVLRVREAAAKGSEPARLALKMFTRSIAKAMGGFCWLLGGLDAIVFTGGIGEHDAATRREVLDGIQEMGIALALEAAPVSGDGFQLISSESSRCAVYVAPADEDWMIAIHVEQMAQAGSPTEDKTFQNTGPT
jgi:acetate kinase